jgi:ATP-binding cassette subfamily A (ABC1) protein 3
MTAREHLEFYSRVRGIKNVRSDVDTVLAMVGLTSYESFLVAKLSGGNKRRLSLAISLLGRLQSSSHVWFPPAAASNRNQLPGNPDILLLDEPSSSMDAVAKRNMWQTLARIAPGRSILLTVRGRHAPHMRGD